MIAYRAIQPPPVELLDDPFLEVSTKHFRVLSSIVDHTPRSSCIPTSEMRSLLMMKESMKLNTVFLEVTSSNCERFTVKMLGHVVWEAARKRARNTMEKSEQ